MTDAENEKLRRYLSQNFSKDLPSTITEKIDLTVDSNGVFELRTSFGDPHLDVAIVLEGGEFVASYSNGNYGEHWYSDKEPWEKVAQDIYNLVCDLIRNGALQTDKVRKGVIYSSNLIVGKSENTTDVRKISPLPKEKVTKIYPAVSQSLDKY